MPMSFDPYGLLDDIVVGGMTVKSCRQEIEDQNRKPPSKKKKDDVILSPGPSPTWSRARATQVPMHSPPHTAPRSRATEATNW